MRTDIENYVINEVKRKRIKAGLSQSALATHLGVTTGFIGKIESTSSASKYNLNHIKILAQVFRCSPKEFLPEYIN